MERDNNVSTTCLPYVCLHSERVRAHVPVEINKLSIRIGGIQVVESRWTTAGPEQVN